MVSFVSYAQNFEDVMLWRALGHIPNGFYIDIGAQGPIQDSVSKGFYDKGWRGIHIEPLPDYANELRVNRPGDVVIEGIVGKNHSISQIYSIPNTGLSTVDPKIAEMHKQSGYTVQHFSSVTCMTLTEIADQYALGRSIHWLKIDVEGAERNVIEGWDRDRIRPWIVVIESVYPKTYYPTHEEWESLLTEGNYRFVYFDGINRFYVAGEHTELLNSFNHPPCILDVERGVRLIPNNPWQLDRWDDKDHEIEIRQAEVQAAQAVERASQAEVQAAQAVERAGQAEAQIIEARQQYEAFVNSLSWKLTKPMRLENKFIQWLIRGSIAWLTFTPNSRPRRMMRVGLIFAMDKVRSHPHIKMQVLKVLNKFPGLKQRLWKISFAHSSVTVSPDSASFVARYDVSARHFSPRARQIYTILKTAINSKQSINQ